jgi:hypothetical protein
MAIKNLLKNGTYTRINHLTYEFGLVSSVSLYCYDATPSLSYKEARTEDENGETPDESANVIHKFVIDDIDLAGHLEIDAGVNMHAQVYEFLMDLDLMDGCISDE